MVQFGISRSTRWVLARLLMCLGCGSALSFGRMMPAESDRPLLACPAEEPSTDKGRVYSIILVVAEFVDIQ
jgi:hypothetical protein